MRLRCRGGLLTLVPFIDRLKNGRYRLRASFVPVVASVKDEDRSCHPTVTLVIICTLGSFSNFLAGFS